MLQHLLPILTAFWFLIHQARNVRLERVKWERRCFHSVCCCYWTWFSNVWATGCHHVHLVMCCYLHRRPRLSASSSCFQPLSEACRSHIVWLIVSSVWSAIYVAQWVNCSTGGLRLNRQQQTYHQRCHRRQQRMDANLEGASALRACLLTGNEHDIFGIQISQRCRYLPEAADVS